jgi:hypothetical protein
MKNDSYMNTPVTDAVNLNALDFFPPNSDNQWPILKDMWAFFAGNAGNIAILTVNASTDVMPDLKLAEKVGAKLTVCTTTDSHVAYWNDIKSILKDRMKSPILQKDVNYTSFAKCWVLSNRVTIVHGLPSLYNGTIVVKPRKMGDESATESTTESVTANDESEGLTIPLVSIDSITTNSYYDIVKIDYPGQERFILNNLYEYGMRPSLVMVRWENDPDKDPIIRAAAATLVNHGYSFLAKVDNKYLYHYNDKPFYNLCSYSKPNQKNPMIESAVNFAKTAIFKQLSTFLGFMNEPAQPTPAPAPPSEQS